MSFRSVFMAALLAGVSFGPAMAADLYTPPPQQPVFQPAPEPMRLRSGFYIGANTGLMRGTYDVTVVTLPDPPYSGYGGLAGAQAGYDYYSDSGFMIGIEGDLGLTTLHHDTQDSFNAKNSSDMLWLATLRGRLGAPVSDSVLLYATGGLAVAELRMERGPDNIGRAPGNHSNVHWGWTVGAGAEFAITNNILLRGEYLYMDFDEQRYRVARGLPAIDNTYSGHLFRTALNYKFD